MNLQSLVATALLSVAYIPAAKAVEAQTVRFATFNVSFYGNRTDEVRERLSRRGDPQAAAIAEIIQRVRPDVLLLNEFDYDATGTLIDQFQKNYLAIGQHLSNSPDGPAQPIEFAYRYLAPPNTGVSSGYDLDRNGHVVREPGSAAYGNDCWGFGHYPGQYAMVLLSRYPIDTAAVRTFQKFRWKDMPGARLPHNPATPVVADWYAPTVLETFPLSSKSHWDVPIKIDGRTVHVLASHPTPPTYDGPEDRNGRRNHDEIRFWVDYITPHQSDYVYDDQSRRGGLPPGADFVILGDLNGDPHDGQSKEGIQRLLASPLVAGNLTPESEGGAEQAIRQGKANIAHAGNPRLDTLDAPDRDGPGNLRVDYVIPASHLQTVASGVFWPKNEDALFSLVGVHPFASSDHRLVWVDVAWEGAPQKK